MPEVPLNPLSHLQMDGLTGISNGATCRLLLDGVLEPSGAMLHQGGAVVEGSLHVRVAGGAVAEARPAAWLLVEGSAQRGAAGEMQRQSVIGHRQIDPQHRLDPPDPRGDRVPVHAEDRRRLGH